MNTEIAEKCPRCGGTVYVAPMQAGGIRKDPKSPEMILAHDLALGYQCIPCDWFVIQPASNKLPVADFLAAAVGAGGQTMTNTYRPDTQETVMDMVTITVVTTESENPVIFDAQPYAVESYVNALNDPNKVITFTPRNGGVAYIPVRQITYLHVGSATTD
ncbi:hypothetical protein ACQP2Y_21035 [Actinoplanes sp. CA-051413]|uniref:hypothetical protein n=1 Tax=Actinoplanes sp. CA-051413 TaxID=3239899 RepID=UPI003D96A7E3